MASFPWYPEMGLFHIHSSHPHGSRKQLISVQLTSPLNLAHSPPSLAFADGFPVLLFNPLFFISLANRSLLLSCPSWVFIFTLNIFSFLFFFGDPSLLEWLQAEESCFLFTLSDSFLQFTKSAVISQLYLGLSLLQTFAPNSSLWPFHTFLGLS